MLIDNAALRLGGQSLRFPRAGRASQITYQESYSPQSLAPADLDRQQWRLLVKNVRTGSTPKEGKGFTKDETAKLTPLSLAKMSKGQLSSVNRETLTNLHLEFGRELFNETSLTDDRHYGSKNSKRSSYTEALGRIVRIHGDSPVGQEAASMLADSLDKIGRVEKREFKRTGGSIQAKNEKYGFSGGAQLFHHLSMNPGLMAGSEDVLQTLHDTKLNTVGPKHTPNKDTPAKLAARKKLLEQS